MLYQLLICSLFFRYT